ncbi:MAG: flagellar protein FlaG [bacterium]
MAINSVRDVSVPAEGVNLQLQRETLQRQADRTVEQTGGAESVVRRSRSHPVHRVNLERLIDRMNSIRKAGSDSESVHFTEDELGEITSHLNDIVSFFSTDIRFSYIKEAGRMQISVIEIGTNRVIKKIPPDAAIDTMISIRNALGMLIDERA